MTGCINVPQLIGVDGGDEAQFESVASPSSLPPSATALKLSIVNEEERK
jgi:hypothetical protein